MNIGTIRILTRELRDRDLKAGAIFPGTYGIADTTILAVTLTKAGVPTVELEDGRKLVFINTPAMLVCVPGEERKP